MPTLYETLRADIIIAMKARDTATATALRTMDAAIQRASMDTAKPIDEARHQGMNTHALAALLTNYFIHGVQRHKTSASVTSQ